MEKDKKKVKEPSEMREKELLKILSLRFGVCVTGMVVCTEKGRLARRRLWTC